MKHEPFDPGAADRAPASSPDGKALAPFTPAVLRHRHDGWTPERQIAFIEKLAESGSVTAACAHVRMSRQSADRLRRRWCARAFRDAWDAAVDCSYAEVEEAAAERSKHGVARPIFYKGEQIGEWRHHDERLTMFLLRWRRRQRFGPEADSLPRPDRSIPGCAEAVSGPFEPESALDGHLDAIAFAPPPPDDEESEAEEQ